MSTLTLDTDWRLARRLALGLTPPGPRARWLGVIVALAAWAGIAFSAAIVTRASDEGMPLVSLEFLMLLLLFAGRLARKLSPTWRALPVTARERHAGAWLLVMVAPQLANALTSALAVGFVVLLGNRYSTAALLPLTAVHSAWLAVYGLMLLWLGDWQTGNINLSLGDMRWRNWAIHGSFLACLFGGMFAGPMMMRQPLVVAGCAGATLILLALGLMAGPRGGHADAADIAAPASRDTLRWLGSLPAFGTGVPGLSGATGFLVAQALRTNLVGLTFMAMMALIGWIIPDEPETGPSGAAFHHGLHHGATLGTDSVAWVGPPLASLFALALTAATMLKQRRLLLSLPHGATMAMTGPLAGAAPVFAIGTLLRWHAISAAPDGWSHLALSGLVLLGVVYVLLGSYLRATTVLATGLGGVVLGLGCGVLAALGPVLELGAQHHPAWQWWVVVSAAALLTLGLWWCRHQFRHGRAAYSPWPATATRWAGE